MVNFNKHHGVALGEEILEIVYRVEYRELTDGVWSDWALSMQGLVEEEVAACYTRITGSKYKNFKHRMTRIVTVHMCETD
jgi:hypothetical protein